MKTVLVVDDEPENRLLLKLLLTAEGYGVVMASNGSEAFDRARNAPPDLIISDVHMPVMDGYALCRNCKRDATLGPIPFVFYTATYTGPNDAKLGLQLGAARYIVKPVKREVFTDIVRKVLDEYAQGVLASAPPPRIEDASFLQLYNDVLVRQLQSKMDSLERANQALRASEARFQRLAEHAQDLIYRYRLLPTPAFEYVSPTAEVITGYTPDEHYADPDLRLKLVHPDDRARFLAEAEAPPRTTNLRWVRKDGAVLWIEQINVPIYDERQQLVAIESIARDVTARRRDDETLRRQAAALEAAANAIIITDCDGSIEWVNPAFCQLTGYAHDEVIGHNPRELVYSGAQAGEFYADLWQTVLSGHVWQGELVNRRKDGTLYTEEQTITPVRSVSGEITHLIGIKQDITLRKQHEREVEAVAALGIALRATMTRAEILPILLEQVTTMLEVEAATVQTIDPATGELVAELATGAWASLTGDRTPPDDGINAVILATRQPFLTHDVAQSDQVSRLELLAWCQSLAGVPLLAQQQIIGLLWIGARRRLSQHDIRILTALADMAATALDRAALFERTEMQAKELAQIMRSTPEGIVLLSQDYRVLLANPPALGALQRLAGAGVGDLVTKLGDWSLDFYLTPPPKGLWHETRVQGIAYELLAQPVESGPRGAGWVLVIRDVTQERAEGVLMRRQERLAAIGQMAAGIAHDFNNIISVIVMYAEMAAAVPTLSDRDRSRLRVIQDQALRASQMIRQILDFSRQSTLERQVIDLLPLLKEQVKLLQRTLGENIEIVLDYSPGEYMIKADPTRMQQMVMNLAINARDAMGEGGRLLLQIARLPVADAKGAPLPGMAAGSWLRLVVEDTGTGMPPEVMAHIFEPFFTTKGPNLGTGLGLAQVHGIIGQHDGHIAVDSTPGLGTTFTIYLPNYLVVTAGSQDELAQANIVFGQGQTVLVVEDDESLRATLVELLATWHYRVEAVSNGAEALAWMQTADRVDLVLSDVVMPKMGGPALLRALRERNLLTPVILLTGHGPPEELEELRRLGLHSWLRKPLGAEELARELAHALDIVAQAE